MIRAGLSFVLLVVVYALALGSFDRWDLLLGAAVSAAVLAVFRPFLFRSPPPPAGLLLKRLLGFPVFAGAVLVDIIRGTWAVALTSARIKPLGCSGIVGVPIGERTPLGIAVTALVTTLSPGSFLVEVDAERGMLWFHMLDASDPERTRRLYAALYEHQKRVFP